MESFAPKRILVGTDLSDFSILAVQHAVLWTRRFGAELTVLYVQEPPPVWGDPYLGGYNLAGLVEAAWETAEERLKEHVTRHVPEDVSVSREIMSGSPATVIEEFAASGSMGLVVLGTHGRGGLGRLLLGSVAERALRMARQPTLIVRPPAAAEEGSAQPPRVSRILCPVNCTEVAHVAFEHAAGIASAFGARLTAVFAVEEAALTPGVAGPGPLMMPDALRAAQERLQEWLPAAPAVEFELEPVVLKGDAAEQVILHARKEAADLIVIGARHRRFVDTTTVLGVTTERVTRHAPCPVLVVPRDADGS